MILEPKAKTESGHSVSLILFINCMECKEVETLMKFRRWKKKEPTHGLTWEEQDLESPSWGPENLCF